MFKVALFALLVTVVGVHIAVKAEATAKLGNTTHAAAGIWGVLQ
jgi:hypothetical protein